MKVIYWLVVPMLLGACSFDTLDLQTQDSASDGGSSSYTSLSTSLVPGSAGSSSTPSVKGSVRSDASLVKVFSNSSCLTEIGSGTRATFIGAVGIAFDINLNASNPVYVRAFDAQGDAITACVSAGAYVHDSVAPTTLTVSSPDPGLVQLDAFNWSAVDFTGTCNETSGTVGLYSSTAFIAGNLIASTTCNGSTWTMSDVDLSDLASGAGASVTYYFRRVDAAGNAFSSGGNAYIATTYTVDRTDFEVDMLTLSPGDTVSSSPYVDLEVNAPESATEVLLSYESTCSASDVDWQDTDDSNGNSLLPLPVNQWLLRNSGTSTADRNYIYAKFKNSDGLESDCIQMDDYVLLNPAFTLEPLAAGISSRSWNEYQAACLSSGKFEDCAHGAETWQYLLPSAFVDSCETIQVKDFLNAFDWTCEVDGASYRLSTTRLKENVRISSLINASGSTFTWKENYLYVVSRGVTYKATTMDADSGTAGNQAFSNPLLPLPNEPSSGLLDLNASGNTIYVLNSNRSTKGITIGADGVGLVIMNGRALSYSGAVAKNCDKDNSSSRAPADYDSRCVIRGNSTRSRVLLEGKIIGTHTTNPADFGVALYNFNRVRARFLDISGTAQAALQLNGTSAARHFVESATLSSNTLSGLEILGVQYSLFKNITAKDNGHTGIKIQAPDTSAVQYNDFETLTVEGNDIHGVYSYRGRHNLFKDVNIKDSNNLFSLRDSPYNVIWRLVAGHGNTGLLIRNDGSDYSSSGNRVIQAVLHNTINGLKIEGKSDDGADNGEFTALTVAHNSSDGVSIGTGSTGHYFNNLVAVNNGRGVFLGAGSNRFEQIVVANNEDTGIRFEAGSHNTFDRRIVIQEEACSFADGQHDEHDLGPTEAPGAGEESEGCAIRSAKTAVLLVNRPGASAVRSPVLVLDEDLDLSSGTFAGGDFPDLGRCTSTSCSYWKGEVSVQDTAVIFNNSALGTDTVNNTFTNGAACPSELSGTTMLTSRYGTDDNNALTTNDTTTGLRLAYQVPVRNGSLEFNDYSTMCSSGSSCIYLPNFGAYQGSGDYEAKTCNFTNDAVTGVSLFAYPVNGVSP